MGHRLHYMGMLFLAHWSGQEHPEGCACRYLVLEVPFEEERKNSLNLPSHRWQQHS